MDGFFRQFGGFDMPGGMMGGDDDKIEEWCEILGVSQGASERELTRAWRKFVRSNHPDKGGDPDLFKRGQQAYEGLQERNKSTVSRREEKPDPISHQLTIDLEDICEGGNKQVEVKIEVAEERNVCPKCNGRGSEVKLVRHGPIMMQTQVACNRCRGNGVSYVNKRKETNTIDIYIPPGTKDGDKLCASEEGHNFPGMCRGDVIFKVHIRKHHLYRRIQADLAMTKELNLISALKGYDFQIPSIKRGEWLQVKSEGGQIPQPGDVICIEGQGLPQKGNRGVRGNLYIRFDIVLPKPGSFNKSQIDDLKKLLGSNKVRYNMPGGDMNETRDFKEGSKVRLTGLQNQPDLNGCGGIIVKENFRPGPTHAVLLDNGKTVAVREEMLEFATKQKKSKKKRKDGPKKNDYVKTVSGSKVDDPENIRYTESGGQNSQDDDERGGGVQCQQM